ncbi:MAG TPA: hypothetical protein VHN98_04180 [Acidimicrobiales bacterium]|nr:hypothetical protein [Acidimicrobiales bacterium]
MEPARAAAGPSLAAVQPVLDARTAAVRAGDREAWAATIDPNAPAAFRDEQLAEFDGLHSLPLATYALTARLDDSGDLSRAAGTKYGAPVYLPETRQVLRFDGYDDRDAVDSLWLTFVQRGDRWYVAADDDLSGLGLDTARGLWDFGPVAVLRTDHFLVLHHPAQAERARALASIGEDAIATLDRRWDEPWPGRIPMVLPGSVDELEKMLQSTIDLDKFVAFVSYGAVRDDGWVATAPRIYVQDGNLSKYSRAYQVQTLVHELSHAAAAPLAGPFVPAWVHEGIADWVAKGRATDERAPTGNEGHLPRDYEFSTGSQSAIIRSYSEARSAVSYLSARAGVGAPTAFLTALGDPKVAPGSVDFHVDQALRQSAGVGLADLEHGWLTRR